MRKGLTIGIAALLTLIGLAAITPTGAACTVTATRDYGDITANGWYEFDGTWDITAGDLTISYTLDMSGYAPPLWATAWSAVGVGGGAWGWMGSGAPAAIDTNPNSQDIDDKLNLGAPDRYDESSYDATGPETLVTPPIGNPWLNYGVWFDRDGVDQWQAQMWGMIDGVTYNTGGIYDVVITLHSIDDTTGTMFATVNGVETGFYDTWQDAQPHNYPVGKSITGDLKNLRVFASIWGENVVVNDLVATGEKVVEINDVIEVTEDVEHHGIKNSLTVSLNAAQDALDRDQPATAVNILNAFINHVQAQSGKGKISTDLADELITLTSNIIDGIQTT
jgi:hypothetical protein